MTDTEDNARPAKPVPSWYYPMMDAVGKGLTALGLIAIALQFALQEVRGLSGACASCAIIGAVIVARTGGHRQMDRLQREIEALKALAVDFVEKHPDNEKLTRQVAELNERVMHLTDRADLAMEAAAQQRQWVNTVVAGLAKQIERLTVAIEQAPRESVRGIAERLDTLAAQQETLAELVSNPERVVLAMPDSELFESGRRYGHDEARREKEA